MDSIISLIALLIILVPSIIIHEISHGLIALKLGDKTAKQAGRLSPNPLKHIDPFGSILLPFILWAAGAPIIGYAKPVPINPNYFNNPRKGMMYCSIAGPASNISLAVICAFILNIFGDNEFVRGFLSLAVLINLFLAVFNLIPIPPLDGSKVIEGFLPQSSLKSYYKYEEFAGRFGIVIILLIVWLRPGLLMNVLSVVLNPMLRILGVDISV